MIHAALVRTSPLARVSLAWDGTDMVAKVSGQAAAAVAALIALAVCPLAPGAVADVGSAVLIQRGNVLCAVSANDVPRGGGPTVACQLSDGSPFAQSPFSTSKPYPKLNVAVMRGGGQLEWNLGTAAGAQQVDGQVITIGAGQTYHVNGWTVQGNDIPTSITYDATGHGISIDPDRVRQL
jgi:hypothetical protein